MARARDRATDRLTRGRLSQRTGCHIETIRYYERIGLMPDPPRSAGGHRVYDEGHARRLTFIRCARELGFAIDEIRSLLDLAADGDASCDAVKALTLRHAGDIHRRILDLRRIERMLRTMAAQCDDGAVPYCPVIDALSRSAVAP